MPADDITNFLSDREPVDWEVPEGFPRDLRPAGMFQQDASNGLEVVLAEAQQRPSTATIRTAWHKRHANRASPVLLVTVHPAREGRHAVVCGPLGTQPSVVANLELAQVERLADVALSEPDRHAAIRCLLANIPELDRRLPGIRNVGLLATHELVHGVPERDDWAQANRTAQRATGYRGIDLVRALGFEVDTLATGVSVLKVGGEPRAAAIFCEDNEPFDTPSQRLNGVTPVSLALAQASSNGIPWVVLTRASEIRLYPAKSDVGVGRRGRAETYVEANLTLLPPSSAGYLQLLFSSDALADEGHITELLESSGRFASDLAVRLRDRIYDDAVPALAQAIADRMDANPTEDDLSAAYQQVLVILFRLLFTAYAEDKDLLPYRTNSAYADESLTALAVERAEVRARAEATGGTSDDAAGDGEGTDLWQRVTRLWRAVDVGNTKLGVPAYNGGLFSRNRQLNPAGSAIAKLNLTDAEFASALDAVLLNESDEGEGPVDFRSLSVRDFGTIYEGLLESRLSVAQSDLAVKSGQYVPTKRAADVEVRKGSVYLHNRAGVRKSTGSYFTKPFAVEHLLDEALEPALEGHLERLDELRRSGDEAGLYDAFFDFRCADIAMGSGHFLVAAVDRIEARLSGYLALHPIPQVADELQRLRATAYEALGELGKGIEIETASLLRRQVARHCVYGVDLQPVAVDLARLAIWIHTFVPGLPLSFLDHNFVWGNSLTGVSGVGDAMRAIDPTADPGQPSLFRNRMDQHLEQAEPALRRLARTADADKHEIEEAREAHLEAHKAVLVPRALFDLVSASRADAIDLSAMEQEGQFIEDAAIVKEWRARIVQGVVERLRPVHYPTAFPEVFLRDNPGFDCLLGNPPWERVEADEKVWWSQFLPGVRGLSVGKMNAAIAQLRSDRPDLEAEFLRTLADAGWLRNLLRVTFPDMGAGKTDLHKAFCWRNWQLTRNEGLVGIVLPRTVLQSKGSEDWRKEVVTSGTFREVLTLRNHGGWVFDDVAGQYSVALIALQRTKRVDRSLSITGPFASPTAFNMKTQSNRHFVSVSEFLTWSDDASFPQFPVHPDALSLFRKLRAQPRLDIDMNDYTGANFAATQQRSNAATQQRSNAATQQRSNAATQQRSNAADSQALAVSIHSGDQRHTRQAQIRARRWRFRGLAEFHATFDKHRFVLDEGSSAQAAMGQRSKDQTPSTTTGTSLTVTKPKGRWHVYKGESFDLWEPDRGIYYASVNSRNITKYLQQKRLRQYNTKSSAFSHIDEAAILDPNTLPCFHPRIAFRNVTRATDERTIRAALVPGNIVITHSAPFLLRVEGSPRDEAFLIGILSSMVLDWYARRVVELNFTFHLVHSLPVPRVDHESDPLGQRVVEIAGRLAAIDERYAGWAAEVGVPVGSAKKPNVKQDLISELDACVACLYGLDENDLAVLYSTFDEKNPEKYKNRHQAVLHHFRGWQRRVGDTGDAAGGRT